VFRVDLAPNLCAPKLPGWSLSWFSNNLDGKDMNGFRTQELSEHSSYTFLPRASKAREGESPRTSSTGRRGGSPQGLTNLLLLAAFFVCFLTLFGFGLTRWSEGAVQLPGGETEPIATTQTQSRP
jgi:hypothetical protein